MSITPWTIYWITRLDSLSALFLAASAVAGIVAVAVGVWGGIVYSVAVEMGDDSGKAHGRRLLKILWRLLVPVFVFSMASALTPSTKEAVAMIVVPKILANEKVQQLPDNFLNLANEWTEELRPGKEKSR